MCENSQLRRYLNKFDVKINLDKKTIKHEGLLQKMITDDTLFSNGSDLLSFISNKFLYDYAVCGLFRRGERSYNSIIDKYPEIIDRISTYYGINLKKEWEKNQKDMLLNILLKEMIQ